MRPSRVRPNGEKTQLKPCRGVDVQHLPRVEAETRKAWPCIPCMPPFPSATQSFEPDVLRKSKPTRALRPSATFRRTYSSDLSAVVEGLAAEPPSLCVSKGVLTLAECFTRPSTKQRYSCQRLPARLPASKASPSPPGGPRTAPAASSPPVSPQGRQPRAAHLALSFKGHRWAT